MLIVENAAGAPMVELMVPESASFISTRAAFDGDQLVNRHLELYLANSRSGRVVSDFVPTIQITNQLTGEERILSGVVSMFDEAEGPIDWHYGNNLYLPDGRYTITATMDGERAAFTDVVLASDE